MGEAMSHWRYGAALPPLSEAERLALAGAPPDDNLRHGAALFNEGRFFEQHEILEEAWRHEPRFVRHVYQGILQIGVGYYHLLRGNYTGAMNLLETGPRHLEPFLPVCHGIDLVAFVERARWVREAARALGRDRIREFDRGMLAQPIVEAIWLQGPDAVPFVPEQCQCWFCQLAKTVRNRPAE